VEGFAYIRSQGHALVIGVGADRPDAVDDAQILVGIVESQVAALKRQIKSRLSKRGLLSRKQCWLAEHRLSTVGAGGTSSTEEVPMTENTTGGSRIDSDVEMTDSAFAGRDLVQYNFTFQVAPFRAGRMPQETAPKALSRRDLNRILRQARKSGNKRDAALLELLAATGLRTSEMAGLTIDDTKWYTFTSLEMIHFYLVDNTPSTRERGGC
jgi:hypothetical protein